MSLTSPVLAELQACRESLNMLYVNGIMSKVTWACTMVSLDRAIDARIGPEWQAGIHQ